MLDVLLVLDVGEVLEVVLLLVVEVLEEVVEPVVVFEVGRVLLVVFEVGTVLSKDGILLVLPVGVKVLPL